MDSVSIIVQLKLRRRSSEMMKLVSCIFMGMILTVMVHAQDHLGSCPSSIQVSPGSSGAIDCKLDTGGYTYQWTSRDPSWLTYLSDAGHASPHFHAPENKELPWQLEYDRLVFNHEGELIHQATVVISIQDHQRSESLGPKDRILRELERTGRYGLPSQPRHEDMDSRRRELIWTTLEGLEDERDRVEAMEELVRSRNMVSDESPFLRCESRISVESGELIEIPCTGLHPSGEGLLAYRVEFDWPPYNETKILGEGKFSYLVRAPEIQGSASVQMLEIFAQVPDTGQEISQQVEVHVMNRSPRLLCEDITVYEGVQMDLPCSITSDEAPRIQLFSELTPRGLHDHWPTITVPEVSRDTSFTVMVRVFGADGVSVVENEFKVNVQNARVSSDFTVSCNLDPYPSPYVEYEGNTPDELMIMCGLTDTPEGSLVWSLSAEGGDETPIDPLTQIVDLFEDQQTNEFVFVIMLPPEVGEDIEWQYGVLVTENVDGGEGLTDREEVNITILERPDISIECEDVQVRTGDPPVELNCTPSLDAPHRDEPLTYSWSWQSDQGLDLLSGDLTSAMPIFNVPEDQDPPTVEYVYQVTASAENTDPPQDPETLTVTVEKNLGALSMECTSPIELYAGDPNFPLGCAISDPEVSDLSWIWQLQEGPEDRLIAGESGAPPIFRTPGVVENTENYKYEIRASAPFYDISEPESVEIIVLPRRVLSIECEDVRVRTGDPPVELNCTPSLNPPSQNPLPDFVWRWTSENGLDLLSGNLNSAMPVFNVPVDQELPTVEYTYQVTAFAGQVDPPQNPTTLVVTVEKYPIFLECPEEVVFMVGMPPQQIECSVSTIEGEELEYVWQWTPTERLSDPSTGSPVFDIPTRQFVYSASYPYTVMVSAERGVTAQVSVNVIVLDPSQGLVDQVEVTSSELDYGVAGPDGDVMMDPATEQLSGLVYESGQSHAGRMMIRARDSVTVSIEQLESAILRNVDSGRELELLPRFAYSPSCTMFSANNQASRIVQTQLAPGDCHVLRIGGEISMVQADPGEYSGKVSVVMTVNGLDQLFTVPVALIVEPQRRVVLLGPDGVQFRAAPGTEAPLEWDQRISIQPQVAVLSPQTRSGTFELTNPSIHPMEVEVSTEFGYREAREENRFSVGVSDQELTLEDLSTQVTVHPKVVLLSPGETRPVYYAISDNVQMQERAYAAQFNFTVTPREFIDQRRSPTTVQAARIMFQAPGVYIPDSGPASLQASVESIMDGAVVISLETKSIPFYGEVIVSGDSGEELGRSEVLVFTRSRVSVPIRVAVPRGITLQFVPSTLDQLPPPDVYISTDS